MSTLEEVKKMLLEMEAFKESLTRQQLRHPLDPESKKILHEDVPISTGFFVPPGLAAPFDQLTEVTIDGKKYQLIHNDYYD